MLWHSVLRPLHPCTKVTFVYLNLGKETIKRIFDQYQPTELCFRSISLHKKTIYPMQQLYEDKQGLMVSHKKLPFFGQILLPAHPHITTTKNPIGPLTTDVRNHCGIIKSHGSPSARFPCYMKCHLYCHLLSHMLSLLSYFPD